MLVLSILCHLGLAALAPHSISTSAFPVASHSSALNSEPALLSRAGPPIDDALGLSSILPSNVTKINLSQTLWSSIFLVFGLAWTAVHPNYPSPYDSPWMKIRRRVMLMLWAVFLPEMMLYWSVRQWFGARNLWMRFKDKGWSITDAHFLQMGGILLAPVRQEGPDGEQRLYTLSMPVLDAIYKIYSRNEGLEESTTPSDAEIPAPTAPSPSPSPPPPTASELNSTQPGNQTSSEQADLTSTTTNTFTIPAITLSPPPETIELGPIHPSIPSPPNTFEYDEDLLNYASTSTAAIPRRPVRIPLPDISSFAPPPDTIEEPPPPPRPHPPGVIDLPLEDADLGPILAAIHSNLPSCLPVLRSRSVPDIPATKPLVHRNGHIASTFFADPALAVLLGFQLVWFLGGCLARIVYEGWRELLLLEVIVLAYVAMYTMMIVAWWDKPAIGLGAEPIKVVVMGEVPHKRKTLKDIEEKKRKRGRRRSKSVPKSQEKREDVSRSDKGKGVDRSSADGGDESRPPASGSDETDTLNLGLLPQNSSFLEVPPRTYHSPRNGTGNATAPSAASPPPHISSTEDDSLIMTLWKGFVEHWQGYVYFHIDRVIELCLKATGYDRWSREYRVSTNLLYSNAFVPEGGARTWREGRRHRRRVQASVRRTVGIIGPQRESVAGLIGADAYPFHYGGGATGRHGRAFSDEESGVNAEVRRRREAGSGGQSRMSTFYTFTPEADYHSALWEANVKWIVGALCAALFGGVHLLGVAFRETRASEGSVADAFTKGNPSYAPHVFYLICTVLLVVSPLYFVFCGLKLSDKYGYEDRIELAITVFLLELLAIPLIFLYIPARLGVVVVAILQLVDRVNEGLQVAGQVAGGSPVELGFDGFNSVVAWWLDFVPHFS